MGERNCLLSKDRLGKGIVFFLKIDGERNCLLSKDRWGKELSALLVSSKKQTGRLEVSSANFIFHLISFDLTIL
jgi:hypothetical protein